ncbi:MAG TPA: hypothetical protein VML01_07100 [Bryobacterales bacterium]|nr:hypothetical protein [Bryobacterales bacterium]
MHRRSVLTIAFAGFVVAAALAGSAAPPASLPAIEQQIAFDGEWSREWTLSEGQSFAVSVHVNDPESLPPNARIEAAWQGPELSKWAFSGERGDLHAVASADWSKTLHALDPDVYLVYHAPASGAYRLTLTAITDRPQAADEIPRDTGLAPLATPLPTMTPTVSGVAMTVEIRPIDELHQGDTLLETEPNNTPEQAIDLPFAATSDDQVLRVFGGADDLEYYNNTASGKSPDDWYRIEYKGKKPKIFTANLQLVEPVVSARLRVYQPGTPSPEDLAPRELPDRRDFGNANPVPYVHPPAEVIPGPTPVYSYYEGRDINERIHQQDTNFRSFTTRKVEPGGVYYLRVEANQPGYQMEVRLIDPAPYDDPRRAIEQAVYYQLAEIDAWLIHRPRNIALDRRVRDGTSLFGENCMSCHTQSGVWGVADALRYGYRPDDTAQNWRRLVNTMYESLRPTIKLKDAASNTSLAPNDLGDAPAGSRVAGRNIVLHERTVRPKRLHSYQQRRTANYVLQTNDPGGINAAGKGSNFGPNVVFKFAAEILDRAWRDTNDPRYFFGIEEKAKKIVATGNDGMKVSDDLGHRIEFFHTLLPADYPEIVGNLTGSEARVSEARAFQQTFAAQVETDLNRLTALQQDDGSWGFDLGTTPDDGKTWKRLDEPGDPAPTAVALIGLEAAGYGPDDPRIQRATKWLLGDQFEYGLWNHAAQTGFVSSAYVIRALSRLYPAEAQPRERPSEESIDQLPLLAALSHVRRHQASSDAQWLDAFITAAKSEHAYIRYQGLLGIGGSLAPDGVPTLIEHLDDPVKMCREAAFWSLRQLLLDDVGWSETFEAYDAGSARTRQSILQAIVTRVDLAGPESQADLSELTRLLTSGMSDSFAGARAYAYKAAWHWWVWNPPLREAIGRAWADSLLREEPNALVETALRYSTVSMLIVNGQIANQTAGNNIDQQYPELSGLYELLTERRAAADEDQLVRFDRRLSAVAASHFQERGNDGGPGQMGYSTPGSTEFFGKVILATYERERDDAEIPWKKIALEGAANVSYAPLEERLLDLLTTGGIDMVAVAARALANPQSLSLPGRVETLRQLLIKIDRFLADERTADAEALIHFLARVKWDFEGISEREEQEFYRLLISGGSESPQRPSAANSGFVGKPAPGDSPAPADERSALLGRILGDNPTLHRKTVFELVNENGRFWLPSTEWMISYQEGGLSQEEAIEGAVEAEALKVLELTFGRTTEQIVPNGLTSKNTILWWREGVPGARLALAIEAAQDGPHEILTAFLYDREMGIVQFELNGEEIGEPADFYKPNLTPSGPVSLGVHQLNKGENRLTVKMLGANPDAEPNHIFGIDYIKLTPDDGSGSLFTKDERGVDVIDPITTAKDEIIRMFNTWFAASKPEKARELAVQLANKTALRRNPEVRKALAAYVEQEPVPRLRESIQNILNSDDKVYGEQLRKFITEQGSPQGNEVRRLEATPEFIDDILYFRDYVFVEMNKIHPSDAKACISCHGVPGRVPTLYLEPPDAAGYIPPDKLLDNYRKMQQRVDLRELERSKLLQKPLNIQTGKEDGHQGGQRFEAGDAGYQVIRQWVLKQAELQRAVQ